MWIEFHVIVVSMCFYIEIFMDYVFVIFNDDSTEIHIKNALYFNSQ